MAQAVHNALPEGQAEAPDRALSFDTTTSNTGRSAGACIIFEQHLEKHLLHFACHYTTNTCVSRVPKLGRRI